MSASKRKYIYPVLIVVAIAISSFVYFVQKANERKASDRTFILIDEKVSNDSKYKLISYKFDTGALGYSRIFWAVVPYQYHDLDLRSFELPDGYKGIGWSGKNELQAEEWKPYYHIERDFKLSNGDLYKGVHVKIISHLKR
jgi:hypothetical protein